MSTASNPPDDERHLPGSSLYLHAATSGAGQAINAWLRQLPRGPVYLFEVGGVECALEFFSGHWAGVVPYGVVDGGRWRWGRLESGDPDEDETGEDILLNVALGRPMVPGRAGRRHRTNFPPYADGALTKTEINVQALLRGEDNLRKLTLQMMS